MPRLARSITRRRFETRRMSLARIRNPATLSANVTRSVTQILWEGRRFQLRRPIDLNVRRKGPYHFVGYRVVGIEGYGRSEQEALESFSDVFSATWDWIATTRDDQLGGEARELKKKLSDLVAQVSSVA